MRFNSASLMIAAHKGLIAAHQATRAFSIVLMALAVTQHTALAADDVLSTLGTTILKSIFIIAGVAAAIIFSIIGLRILIGSGLGSSYAVSNGVFALIAAGCGLLLALGGPKIAELVIKGAEDGQAVSSTIYVPSGGGGTSPQPTAIPQ